MSKVQNEQEAVVGNNNEEVKAEVTTQGNTEVAASTQAPMGFEDDNAEDLIIPRVKIIQTLSPERKDKKAEEGDIVNSLTVEKLNGKIFIPVFKFNNNIDWIDRSEGGGIRCMAHDGKTGSKNDGTTMLCMQCKRCEFDNTKTGRDAVPKCTKYINFFGFFAGERMPVILSFGKTNYNEGKKLYSLAKVTMQNMWNFGYTLDNKLMAKSGNEWYIITATPAGATTQEDREFALSLFMQFRNSIATLNYDMDDNSSEAAPKVDTEGSEF